jgi:RNA polymerase sigma-70 factor, ECF subfamily
MFDAGYVQRLTDGDCATEAHFASYFARFVSLKIRARRLAPELADDIRQETLCRVLSTLRKGHGVSAPERFGAFVNSVCNNVILEVNRQRAREVSPTAFVSGPIDDRVNMEGSLISVELKCLVRRVLDDLAEKDREILRLVFLEELDRKEICRKFNIKGDYLRLLLHRAKAKFEVAYIRRRRSNWARASSVSL